MLERVEIFPCRELLPTDEVRARAAKLVALEPWGREQWERLAEGQIFDGMESWLPWLADDEQVLFDLVGADALVLLVEPRRMRDRAADLLAEEADLAATLARTWGAGDDEDFPRLHLPFDRLLAHTTAAAWTVTTAPEGPDVATVQSMGVAAAAGDPERGGAPARRPARPTATASSSPPTARARPPASASCCAATACDAEIEVQPLERGCILPAVQLARPRRARPHRPAPRPPQGPRPARATRRGSSTTSRPATTSCTTSTASPATAAWSSGPSAASSATTCCSSTRATTSSTSRPTRSTRCATTPAARRRRLSRLGGDDWQKAKARVRSAVTEIAQELVVLYQTRLRTPGHAFPQDTPWQRELEDAFPYQETPDQLMAIDDVKADMEAEHPMDRLVCGDVGFGKTEVAIRAAFKAVQDGKQVAVLVPTTLLAQQHHQTFSDRFAGYPVRVEVLSRFLTPAQARQVAEGVRSRRGRRRHRHPPAAVRRHRVQGPRPARRRRGAALRRHPQGADQAAPRPTSTCSR